MNADAQPRRRRSMEDLTAKLGATALAGMVQLKEVHALLRRTLYYSLQPSRDPGAVVRQMYEIGNRSALFLIIAMGFIGMIFVYQAGLQMLRVIPDLSLLGATYLELLVRDLAASIVALLLATRVGAGIAAELGSMVVTEQIDALRMCATDPVDYLLRPRFIACLVMTAFLVILGGSVAFFTGLWTAQAFFDVSPRTFADASLIDASDLVVGFAKCIAYGAAIPIVSAHSGFSTFGGSEGVGRATTRAVVNSSLAIIALNFFISAAGYLLLG